jgi:hypothetical protein
VFDRGERQQCGARHGRGAAVGGGRCVPWGGPAKGCCFGAWVHLHPHQPPTTRRACTRHCRAATEACAASGSGWVAFMVVLAAAAGARWRWVGRRAGKTALGRGRVLKAAACTAHPVPCPACKRVLVERLQHALVYGMLVVPAQSCGRRGAHAMAHPARFSTVADRTSDQACPAM